MNQPEDISSKLGRLERAIGVLIERVIEMDRKLDEISCRCDENAAATRERLDALQGALGVMGPRLEVTVEATTKTVDEILDVREALRQLRRQLPCLPKDCPHLGLVQAAAKEE